MRTRACLVCLILPLVLFSNGCGSRPNPGTSYEEVVMTEPTFTPEQIDQVARLPVVFGTPSRVILFEGMPHPMLEKKLLAQEVSKNAEIQIDGQKFYKRPQTLQPADQIELLSLISKQSSHVPSVLMKLCGGFHADYALRWKVNGGTNTVLLCFGCHEMVIITSNFKLSTDISNDAYSRLKMLLSKYHQLRPATELLP
jgi:hypothetical protein